MTTDSTFSPLGHTPGGKELLKGRKLFGPETGKSDQRDVGVFSPTKIHKVPNLCEKLCRRTGGGGSKKKILEVEGGNKPE